MPFPLLSIEGWESKGEARCEFESKVMMHSVCIYVCILSICMQICTYQFFSSRESVNHGSKYLRLKGVSKGTNNNHAQGIF